MDWLLALAFGPESTTPSSAPLDPEKLKDCGEHLSLFSRIRSRSSPEVLRNELGADLADAVDSLYYANIAMVMRHEAALEDIARVLDVADTPVILLKGMALHYLGELDAGSRRVADIDLLAPADSCQSIYDSLLRAGFQPSGIAAPMHHLSVLFHPQGSAIEIHHVVDGVCLEKGSFATADSCLENGQVQDLEGYPDNWYLPSEQLLLAQLLAHGLGHHGKAPDSYPPFQLLGDLQHLRSAGAFTGRLPPAVEGWIVDGLEPSEARAALDLEMRLSKGERGSEIAGGDSDASVLLRHFVAGSLDAIYLESLKLERRVDPIPGKGRAESLIRTGWGALWLSDQQIEMIYGQPKSPLGYLGYRLWRPFDLMNRLARYGTSWVVSRLRGRGG